MADPASLFALVGFGGIGALAWREHVQLRRRRRCFFDGCGDVLDKSELRHAADGFPCLRGSFGGRNAHLGLIADTMTIRRLPQLWLSITLFQRLPTGASVSAVVRPSGAEFYAIGEALTETLPAPAGFPREVLVRGDEGARSAALLHRAAALMAEIFTDPRVKEVAITPKGLRLVRQAAEGRYGAHLILRQAEFDDGSLQPEVLRVALVQLAALADALSYQPNRAWRHG
jgi:hypothetical protein